MLFTKVLKGQAGWDVKVISIVHVLVPQQTRTKSVPNRTAKLQQQRGWVKASWRKGAPALRVKFSPLGRACLWLSCLFLHAVTCLVSLGWCFGCWAKMPLCPQATFFQPLRLGGETFPAFFKKLNIVVHLERFKELYKYKTPGCESVHYLSIKNKNQLLNHREFLNPVYTTGEFSWFLQSCLYVISPLTDTRQRCLFICDPCPLYTFSYYPTYLRNSWYSIKGWHTLWRLFLDGVLEGNIYATPRKIVQLSRLRLSSREVETCRFLGAFPTLPLKSHTVNHRVQN